MNRNGEVRSVNPEPTRTLNEARIHLWWWVSDIAGAIEMNGELARRWAVRRAVAAELKVLP